MDPVVFKVEQWSFLETLMMLQRYITVEGQNPSPIFWYICLGSWSNEDFLKPLVVIKSVHGLIVMVEKDDFLNYALMVICPCFLVVAFPLVFQLMDCSGL